MTANPHRGEVRVRLCTEADPDGKDYTLRPSFDAVVEIEEGLGKAMGDVVRDLTRMSARAMAVTLRAFLKAGGTEWTTAQVGGAIMRTGAESLLEPIVHCLNAYFGGEKDAKRGNGKAAKAGA